MDMSRDPSRKVDLLDVASEDLRQTDDQVGLIDLWLLLARWKSLFVGIFLATSLSATTLAFVLPPVFESRAVIQIGEIPADKGAALIEAPESLVERLKEEYRLNNSVDRDSKVPYMSDVRASKSAKNIITITAHGSDSSEAHDFLSTLSNKVLSEHKNILELTRHETRGDVSLMEKQIAAFNQQIAVLSDRIRNVGSVDLAAATTLVVEKNGMISQVTKLELEHIKLARQFTQFYFKPTRLLADPTRPISPVAPKKGLYVILGIVLGLILAGASVLTADFFQKARTRVLIRKGSSK